MDRRGFLGGLIVTAAGLYLPYQPERVYSFPSARFLKEEELISKMIRAGLLPSQESFQSVIVSQVHEIRQWNNSELSLAHRITNDILANSDRNARILDSSDRVKSFLPSFLPWPIPSYSLRYIPSIHRIVSEGVSYGMFCSNAKWAQPG